MTRQLPKSLHTISVLVNLTRHLMGGPAAYDAETAMKQALRILKLDEMPDNYNLAEKALLQINRTENKP